MELTNDANVRRAAEAIEEIGYGRSQIFALLFGAGVAYIAEKFDIDSTGVVLDQFGADPNSLWAMAISWLMTYHIELGLLVSFLLGDVMGRRWSIVRGLGTAAVASWLCILVPNYYVKTAANVVTSICLRSLFVPGLVITSECTQRGSRILHRALGVDCLNATGGILALLAIFNYDIVGCSAGSSWCLLPAAVFSSIFFILAFRFLPESPVFLAGAGEYKQAREELDTMRRLSGAPEGTGDFALSAHGTTEGNGRTWSLRERLTALVGGGRRCRVLLLMSLVLMAVKKGVYDAEAVGSPVFFSESNLGHNEYTLGSAIVRVLGEGIAFCNAVYFSRNVALGNSLLIFIVITLLYVVFNPLRGVGGVAGLFVESIAQCAGVGMVYGCRVVLTVGYQICLEFWPTMSAVSAASVVIGMGYCKLWLHAWPWFKSFWPAELAPMLDVVQLLLLVPVAYSARELQGPASGLDSGGATWTGKGAAPPYGTFKGDIVA